MNVYAANYVLHDTQKDAEASAADDAVRVAVHLVEAEDPAIERARRRVVKAARTWRRVADGVRELMEAVDALDVAERKVRRGK